MFSECTCHGTLFKTGNASSDLYSQTYIYHNTNRVCLFFLKVIQNTIVGQCEDWDELKERTSMRLKLLEESRDIHSFENNVEDTKIWMQEKQGMLMYAVELGKDCASVKKLFRKHEELEVC